MNERRNLYKFNDFILEFKESEKNTKVIFKNEKLEVIVVNTLDATKNQNINTNWCTSHDSAFYMHNGSATLYRFNFSDGYKLRLTWDYIHNGDWGEGGKIGDELVRYNVIRFRNPDNPFDFSEFRSIDSRRMMVDRIQSISKDAQKAVIEYQKTNSMKKTGLINSSLKDIQKISIVNVVRNDVDSYGDGEIEIIFDVTLKYNNKEYKVEILIDSNLYNGYNIDTRDFLKNTKAKYAMGALESYIFDKFREYCKVKSIEVPKIIKSDYYNESLLLEKYDDNIKAKLIEMGVTDPQELKKQISLSKSGNLSRYLEKNGKDFTFGILHAIFKDAKQAKFKTDMKKASFKLIPRLAPLLLAPFFPILAVIGIIFSTSRTFNKVIDPVLNNLSSESKYSDFLKSMVNVYMKIPEGDVNIKDRFSRAFVVSDRLIDALKPEVIANFTQHLSKQMSIESDDTRVPNHYIENELKKYLNDTFDVYPEIPLKDERDIK